MTRVCRANAGGIPSGRRFESDQPHNFPKFNFSLTCDHWSYAVASCEIQINVEIGFPFRHFFFSRVFRCSDKSIRLRQCAVWRAAQTTTNTVRISGTDEPRHQLTVRYARYAVTQDGQFSTQPKISGEVVDAQSRNRIYENDAYADGRVRDGEWCGAWIHIYFEFHE